MPFPSALSALPLDEPDPRKRVIIRGRVVLMPEAWHRCASGVTFDPPPTLGARAEAQNATVTAFDALVLEAIRAGNPHRRHGVGRKKLVVAVFGTDNVNAHNAVKLDAALARLRRRALIEVDEQVSGGTLYRVAA